MAHIVKKTVAETHGREVQLAVLGRACLVLGLLGIVVSIGVAAASGVFGWFVAGLAALVAGVVLSVILGAAAEMIRLLKRLCGIPYQGAITGEQGIDSITCSECGCPAWPDSTWCDGCGCPFETAETVPPGGIENAGAKDPE